MEAQEQAKQLDSVTDRVQEKEVDATKAQQAMASLSAGTAGGADAAVADQVKISKEDIDLIMAELEVTADTATKALREAAADGNPADELVVAALRKLVTS